MSFLFSALATYRLAYLFTQEDGPLMVFSKMRSNLEGVPILGEALGCIYCFSLWCAVPVWALTTYGVEWPVELLAFSAAAMLLYEALELLRSFGVVKGEELEAAAQDELPGLS